MTESEVTIVGGGPAGSSCARELGRLGVGCLVLDSESFPREKLCGGWLTPETVADLELDPQTYPHGFLTFEQLRIHLYGLDFSLKTTQHSIRRYEFDAWLLDRDFRNPERAAVDVRVLLTRDQLSDLHDVLAAVLERAEEGMLSPQTFLDELQSLAATMTRDPGQMGAASVGQGSSLALTTMHSSSGVTGRLYVISSCRVTLGGATSMLSGPRVLSTAAATIPPCIVP